MGRSIVLVTVWGAPGWRADVSVTSPVAMPAEPAEPSADAPPPAPEEKDDGEGEAPAGQESQ